MFALVFAPATVSPLVLRPTRTAYCAADVVKRRRFKKKDRLACVGRGPLCCRCSKEQKKTWVWQSIAYMPECNPPYRLEQDALPGSDARSVNFVFLA